MSLERLDVIREVGGNVRGRTATVRATRSIRARETVA